MGSLEARRDRRFEAGGEKATGGSQDAKLLQYSIITVRGMSDLVMMMIQGSNVII